MQSSRSRLGGIVGAGVIASFLVVTFAGLTGCKLLKMPEKKAFGADCSTDLDCDSMKCQVHGKICSKTCTYDSECGGDLVCREESTANSFYCAKKEGTDIGGPCANRDDCNRGECLHRIGEEDKPGICSGHCQTANDCPAHFKTCDSISDSGGTKLCLPGEAGAPAGSAKFGKKGGPTPPKGPVPPAKK
jgi:hypothetical protein